MIAAVDDAFRHADVLLTASALVPPCQIDGPRQLAAAHQLQAWTPFNIIGHPAVSLMAGLSRSGLPLSMQLVGPVFGETLVLEVAAAYEQCTEWRSLRPWAIST
jgi:aspartyl-tRNA(Asn)/glutamyl-tRNA(Gln) amidotransferase subunit A